MPVAPPISGARIPLPQAVPPEQGEPAEAQAQRCPRHPSEFAVQRCTICSKPICSKCMELFGYFCGPHCKAKAEARGLNVPAYAGLKSAAEARFWRKTGRIATVTVLLVALSLGFWAWYEWLGSRPKVVFSVRFSQPAWSGQSAFAGPDQLVFLHGGLLARQDLKANKEVWSRQLIQDKDLNAIVAAQTKELEQARERAIQNDPDNVPRMPGPDRLRLRAEKAADASLDLRVRGQNIWVIFPGKLVHYDWETGNPDKEVALPAGAGPMAASGDQLLLMAEADSGEPCVTRINLATCNTRTETLSGAPVTNAVAAPGRSGALAGMPVGRPGRDLAKPMDPAKVARQAEHMGLPAKIALPAVLASSRNQEQALAEMSTNDRQARPAPNSPPTPAQTLSLIPTRDGFLQFSTRLVERRIVTRNAMKPAPAKSALTGALTVGNTANAANEILNDMQRSRGGDVVQEDQSRYAVTLQTPDGKEAWSGEVTGPPSVFCLETVNVVAADKTVVVLDKANKQLWQATLSYAIDPGWGEGENERGRYGRGPCVEHHGALYVIDQATLAAFDLATGNRRWSLPSVGTAGVFFDDQDNIYVNTSTASLDAIRYSRQIDISQNARAVIFKIDARTGTPLWRAQPGGLISYVSGQFVYTVQSYVPEEPDEDGPPSVETGFETPPYMRIWRINPRNGSPMWEHFQQRAPLDVQFDKNRIRLVFKKEVQVLKYLAL